MALGVSAILFAWCARPVRPPVLAASPSPAAGPPSAAPSSPGSAGPGGARQGPAVQRADDVMELRRHALLIPVAGFRAEDLRDSFADAREGHVHEAIDILAPRGTKVIAADDGTVVKLLRSRRGGLSVYQFDAGSSYCYYYAHLDRYALRLHEGLAVRKGDTIGYVGTSGNASWRSPHLHFAVLRLGPEKLWNRGTAVNPYPIWARGE
jgi:murein DD-endopeptidase MepM/ murein hydrolase activator NlpD